MTREKFVLFSAARSGTSFVTETLGAHPEVRTFGEIFHKTPEVHLPAELRTEEALRLRRDAPIEFAHRVLNSSPEKAIVGFKMWLDQNPVAAEALLKDSAIKKIILKRTNKLATFTSNNAAVKSGIWNVKTAVKIEYHPPLLPFVEAFFDRHVRHHEAMFTFYRDKAVGDILEITYSELLQDGLGKVMTFLGLPKVDLPPQTYRLLTSQMLDRFEPDAQPRVVAHMQKIGKTEWLDPE